MIGTAVGGWYYYQQHYSYTSYETVWEIPVNEGSLVGYQAFGSNVLKYTKDGASYTDNKGKTIWTESYEMKADVYKRQEKNKIRAGKIFVTRTGKAMDRSNIWREMKKLAKLAGVGWEKVFPHNLRHLFARSFYSQEKDLLRLADILGHSSINTTRIYTMETGEQHVRQLEQMDLLVSDYNRISLLL